MTRETKRSLLSSTASLRLIGSAPLLVRAWSQKARAELSAKQTLSTAKVALPKTPREAH